MCVYIYIIELYRYVILYITMYVNPLKTSIIGYHWHRSIPK